MRTVIDRLRRHINIWMFLVVAISLLPILYCGLWIYPSADEMSKSYTVRAVVLAGGNLLEVLRAAIGSAYHQWATVEGNYASNLVMALQPGIWGEHGLAVTVPLCILYVSLGSAYFCHELFIRSYGMSRRACTFLVLVQVFLILQYMPFIRGGMFMYVGMVHYYMPMCFVLLMSAWLLKWIRTGRRRYYVYMLLCAVYIGGSHYQHLLVMLLVLLTAWIVVILGKRIGSSEATGGAAETIGARIHLIWILVAILLAGLYISAMSPGNTIRGQGTYGIHVGSILLMPTSCAAAGVQHAVEYISNAPFLIVYAIVLWYIGRHCMSRTPAQSVRRIPAIVIAVYLFLLYAATEAPAIYAADNPEGISGVYYDTVWQSLVLVMTIGIPLIASRVPQTWKGLSAMRTTILCLALCVICLKPSIKNSSTWTCVEFLRGGHFDDYRIQMAERNELFEDPNLQDIYVPEMNDQQGPYLMLQLSQDSSNYTNMAHADYYNKTRVTAVPRDVYYAEYAEAQGHGIPEAYRELYSQ